MTWMLSTWMVVALLPLCRGQNTLYEGNGLSESGFHLCILNVTRTISSLVVHEVPYTVTKPCGGWLLWKTCTVTLYRMTYQTEFKTVVEQVTRCCDGYEQVGRYCALPVNRSREFIAKPGSCPTADGLYPESEHCVWDMDCPGWQKCCQSLGRSFCSEPAGSANYSENGGYRLKATVTVKTDYQLLMSKEKGLLNHTRLLQAMVSGALQSDNITVYYLSFSAVHPYNTATSLLIEFSFTCSLHDVTSKLHLLLEHIPEVSAVTVEDVNECAEPALRQCSPQADCNNTVGSYKCACHQGYIDVDLTYPGAHCTADIVVRTTTEFPLTHHPHMNITYTSDNSTRQNPQGNRTMDIFSSSDTSMTTALSNTSSVPYNSSHAPQQTQHHLNMSTAVELPLPTATCTPPSITSLWSANVTEASFCAFWSDQFDKNQSYQVVLSKGSEIINIWHSRQTMMEMRGLQPGVIYNVTVTPHACGNYGLTHSILVKTDAQIVDATAHLTNIEFSADLLNSSSQAYKNLTESIIEEIYQSLSQEMKAIVDSGHARIEIRSFSPGSVVVDFTIVSTQSQNISDVSIALLHSLMTSSKYTVDRNNTRISDLNECTSGENDCSHWATCINTWGSFTCVCLEGFTDTNSVWPGRACQAIPTLETTPPPLTTTMFSTFITTSLSQLTTLTSDPALTTGMTPHSESTNNSSTTEMDSAMLTSIPQVSITTTVLTTEVPVNTSAQTVSTATTATIAPSTSTSHPLTTTIYNTTTTSTAVTSITAREVTLVNTVQTTNTTTTSTPPFTTTNYPITNIYNATTTSTEIASMTLTREVPLVNTVQTTNISDTPFSNTPPSTTTNYPTTTIYNATATSNKITSMTSTRDVTTGQTTTSTPSSIVTNNPTTTSAAVTSMTSTPPSTFSNSNTTASTINVLRSATNVSMSRAISVQCRVASITVSVARDFLLMSKIRESDLYLGLMECGINEGNATHARLTVAWNECDTRIVYNDTYYTASVTLFNTMDPYITPSGTVEVPRIRLEVPIVCSYMKSAIISADLSSMGYDLIKDIIMGLGSFQVTVQLMNGTVPLPHNYSMSSQDVVVVEVSLNTSSEQIKLITNKCWATSSPNPADAFSYTFLENSCSLNMHTKILMNGNSTKSRVSVQIFSLVSLDMIYLHCQVRICVQTGMDTCLTDCLQRTARSSNTFATGFGSSGALLRLDEKSTEPENDNLHLVGLSCLGVGLSLFFIVGFVCLFYYQRNRIGHYNFTVKPKQENFTYLVFNA